MAARMQLQPPDEHNQRLQANVHPPDWVNPTPAARYNLVVIGAGTAGLVTAAGAAGLGAKVALVERDLMGGDCLNVGCVPSKGIIRSARVAAAVRDAEAFGVRTGGEAHVDFAAVMQRMRRLRADISPHDSAPRLRDLGVDVFLGQGSFHGPDCVEVDGRRLHFHKAVIASGARAATPPIPGLKDIPYLTNESVFSLTELPRRLAVIGAGPIGCELAQAFARFGSEVHLIESTHGILPREDPDAAQRVQQALVRDGVQLLCCGQQTAVSPAEGRVRIRLDSHNRHYDLVVDQLLVAVGRTPNVEDLNLKAASVQYDPRTGVTVNDKLQTTHPRIYAAGDVCSKFKFTHAADFMARIVIQNALFLPTAKVTALTIPWCTYTSPEIAHVGLSEHDARQQGVAIDTLIQEMAQVDRAILDGETEGFVKVHLRKGKDQILGATIVAADAGNMISEITLAMNHGIGLKKIAHTIHPYPTQAEAIRKLGDACHRRRLTPWVKSSMQKWLAWQR
ncbi:MAG: FAD-containing oxidoreductase [Planctomycetales bacterium]|nr:FAD-containing oxidoreductase [Planctomycetales bacterium]NIM08673.1 FAD-containing oxidoreductase [Planctomycetales bacterium]NIN08147.1 FAD-containing oxidoreductase [Planctomycetales bacterium]NIN77274.1 FAD-containing oxidoreductase [Planctomycetales bacterium]NIO34458.1 FAD-containing oxidoreductase [Planctomycetales bacterium]